MVDHRFRAELRLSTSLQLEGWLWYLCTSLEEYDDQATRAFLQAQISDVRRELRLRERIADPVRPLRTSSAKFDLERIREDFPLTVALPAMAAVELTKSGNRWVGRCPFPDHQDGSPSLSVRPDGRVWHCFGCHRGGDVFTFSQEWYAAQSFRAAVTFVLSAMGVPEDTYLERSTQPRKGVARVA